MSFARRRQTVEKEDYFTNRDLVDKILQTTILPLLKENNIDTFVDTSAGDGYTCKQISALAPNVNILAYEKNVPEKTEYELVETDFLQVSSKGSVGRCMVGFNPPYGVSGMLAKRFIEHATSLYDPLYIVMILPYISTTKKYKGLTLVSKEQLPDNSFYRPEDGRPFRYITFLCVFKKS